jgi:hypothetical protein
VLTEKGLIPFCPIPLHNHRPDDAFQCRCKVWDLTGFQYDNLFSYLFLLAGPPVFEEPPLDTIIRSCEYQPGRYPIAVYIRRCLFDEVYDIRQKSRINMSYYWGNALLLTQPEFVEKISSNLRRFRILLSVE